MQDLSASALRRLLIDRIQQFIVTLDNGSTNDLQEIKHDISNIFIALDEKEKEEVFKLYGEKIPLIFSNPTTTFQ